MKLVTAEQMRELEQAAVRAGISEAALMEHAGLAAAQEAWMAVGAVEGRPLLVLVGPGKNGGDGLVAARHLAGWGARVHVYLLRPRPDDDPHWSAAVEAGVPVTAVADDADLSRLVELLDQSACVLDALLEKYADQGIVTIESMNVLRVQPLDEFGTPVLRSSQLVAFPGDEGMGSSGPCASGYGLGGSKGMRGTDLPFLLVTLRSPGSPGVGRKPPPGCLGQTRKDVARSP